MSGTRSVVLTAKGWAAVGGYNPQHQLPDGPVPTGACRWCEGSGIALTEHGLLSVHWRSGAMKPRMCTGVGSLPKAVS